MADQNKDDEQNKKKSTNNDKPKPPGRLSAFTVIVFLLIVGLIVWIFFAFFPFSPGTFRSTSDFQNDIHLAIMNSNIYFRDISYNEILGRISVVFDNNGTISSYLVNVSPGVWANWISGSTTNLFPISGTIINGVQASWSQALNNAIIAPSGSVNGTLSVGVLIQPPNGARTALFSLLPFILIVAIIILFYRFQSKSGGGIGGFNPGKNQAQRVYTKKRFSDIAGNEEVKEEVGELVDYLKYPKKYASAGARIPKGVLLGGPPGTGKTLIAKATAGEANVPFFFISGSNFVELFVGVGAKRVRELFKEARKAAPAIIFIDELDAVGRSRGAGIGGGNDEREQTLNQLLVEMDGITENNGLLVMAATNRTDVLDPALQRPGRFDRTITVGLPNVKEREEILKLHAKGKRISKDVDFYQLAKRTPGYSGAQLENVINEASLLSVRGKTSVITLEQIDEAVDRVMSGPAKKSRTITKEELTMVAYHEAGHAVVGVKLRKGVKVQKITIIPRGQAGGYNLMTPEEEKYNNSKSELIAMITSFMGGRAAEQIKYGAGEVSTGASDDIKKATIIARKMVTEWGMSDLGPIMYEEDAGSPFLGRDYAKNQAFSDNVAQEIDVEVRKIMIAAEQKAIEIIKENLQFWELIKEALLDKETIVAEEIQYIEKNLKLPPKKTNSKDPTMVNKIPSVEDLVKEVKSKTIIVDKKDTETKKDSKDSKDQDNENLNKENSN